MSELENRLIILEQQSRSFEGSTLRMEKKLDEIGEALQSLVRIEERQMAINTRLSDGAQTMQVHAEQIKQLQIAVPEKLDKRLVSIETKIPGLVESRGWVVAGVLGGLAMMGAALAHTVLR
jgi:DNA repair ATPase RecN